jgi:hypothetical protein
MKLLTECKFMTVAVILIVPVLSYAQAAESNPAQVVAIDEGNKMINDKISSQATAMQKTATYQGSIATEFTIMKGWESKYNSYLKKTRGYAEAIQAGTTLYADGVETLQHLYELQRAINANPTGIGATLAMNDLYMETAQEFIKTYRVLKTSIAKGGKENMLTGAERTEMLWELTDALARLNSKLRMLAISIAYHNLTDVWNQATVGIIPRSHSDIAHDAIDRWKRASEVSMILNP